jgi:hypothetical protein
MGGVLSDGVPQNGCAWLEVHVWRFRVVKSEHVLSHRERYGALGRSRLALCRAHHERVLSFSPAVSDFDVAPRGAERDLPSAA